MKKLAPAPGVAALLLALVAGCADSGQLAEGTDPDVADAPASAPWPTNGWATAAPEDHGLDGAALAELAEELRAGRWGNVDSMLLIRNGYLLHDSRFEVDYGAASADYDQFAHQYNYYHPNWHPYFEGSQVHTLQSVTKSWTSALIGIAIGRGEIESVEVPGLSFFSEREFADPDGRKAAMTLEDLLTMRAGFEWNESTVPYTDPSNDCAILEASDDWLQFVLEKPLSSDPGTTFVYNSGVSTLLSGIIQQTTGKTIDLYAEDHLFGPLGIDDYHWKKTPLGLPDTEGGLYLKSEDLAKLGYLFLHDGIWDGQRLLPEGWVAASVSPSVQDVRPDNDRRDSGYGYQWWVPRDGRDGEIRVFAAQGYGGQFLIVAPELDLITVFTGWAIFEEPPKTFALFFDRILPMLETVAPQ